MLTEAMWRRLCSTMVSIRPRARSIKAPESGREAHVGISTQCGTSIIGRQYDSVVIHSAMDNSLGTYENASTQVRSVRRCSESVRLRGDHGRLTMGTPDGECRLDSQHVTKCLGGARLPDGVPSGSGRTMDQALRNLVSLGSLFVDVSSRIFGHAPLTALIYGRCLPLGARAVRLYRLSPSCRAAYASSWDRCQASGSRELVLVA